MVNGTVPSQVRSTRSMSASGSPGAATNDGPPARTDFKNARTAGKLLGASSDTSTTSAPEPATAASSAGSSSRQGSHQVAQKLTTSARPLCGATTLPAYAAA